MRENNQLLRKKISKRKTWSSGHQSMYEMRSVLYFLTFRKDEGV